MTQTVEASSEIDCRQFLIDALERELVGPKNADELLDDSPQQRYIAGQLAPARETVEAEPEADEELGIEEADVTPDAEAADGVDAETDASISRARSESLSSLGMSFVVEPNTTIELRAWWGEYARADHQPARYQRHQREGSVSIDFGGSTDLSTHSFGRVEIHWVARRVGRYLIASVFLVNATKESSGDGTERIYQVGFRLTGAQGTRPFLSRDRVIKNARPTVEDLLFRDRREYGVGLHAAVLEEDVDPVAGMAGSLRTAIVPQVETFVTVAAEFSDPEILSMRRLATARSQEALWPRFALLSKVTAIGLSGLRLVSRRSSHVCKILLERKFLQSKTARRDSMPESAFGAERQSFSSVSVCKRGDGPSAVPTRSHGRKHGLLGGVDERLLATVSARIPPEPDSQNVTQRTRIATSSTYCSSQRAAVRRKPTSEWRLSQWRGVGWPKTRSTAAPASAC